jgi:hypothetical protein
MWHTWRGEEGVQSFCWKARRKETTLGMDLTIREIGWGRVEWIQ